MTTHLSDYIQDKALRLLATDRITPITQLRDCLFARVAGDHDTYYTAVFASGTFTCTCPWGQVHGHTDYLCSHARALQLFNERSDTP